MPVWYKACFYETKRQLTAWSRESEKVARDGDEEAIVACVSVGLRLVKVFSALVQVPRIAKARGISETRLRLLIDQTHEEPLLGLIGEPRVNVLRLNRQLDVIGSMPAQ